MADGSDLQGAPVAYWGNDNNVAVFTEAGTANNAVRTMAPRNPVTTSRYVVLYDEIIVCDDGSGIQKTREKFIPLPAYITYRLAGTGVATDTERNSLWFGTMNATGAQAPLITYMAKLVFEDA